MIHATHATPTTRRRHARKREDTGAGVPAATSMVQAARSYAERGWYVVPVANTPPAHPPRLRTKEPHAPLRRARGPLARLPKLWAQFATTEIAQIRRWWDQWPDANVGIVTGAPSGLLVLHVDGTGDSAVANVCVDLPETVVAHAGPVYDYYFQLPSGYSIREQTGRLPAGIHVRGDRQYVVAPPSVEKGSTHWQWEHSPSDVPLAQLPENVLDQLLRWSEPLPPASGKRMDEAKALFIPPALDEVVQAHVAPQVAALHLGRDLRDAGLDMLSEARPIVREFVEQLNSLNAGKHALTEKRALSILKSSYKTHDAAYDHQ